VNHVELQLILKEYRTCFKKIIFIIFYDGYKTNVGGKRIRVAETYYIKDLGKNIKKKTHQLSAIYDLAP
jgi:hypothetical protein